MGTENSQDLHDADLDQVEGNSNTNDNEDLSSTYEGNGAFLNLSDEELMKMGVPSFSTPEPIQAPSQAPTQAPTQEPEQAEQAEVVDDAAAATSTGTTDPSTKTTDNTEVDNEDPASDKKDVPAEAKQEQGKEGESKDKTGASTNTEAKDEIDYKAEFLRLTSTFKASGKDFKVDSVDDALSLMQMGVAYNHKMAALKPNLKLMKMLESNGLLDEAKLSFLIDLDKRNPDAINKLVKDSGIDPLELTAEKASAYKPNSYKVDPREMQLDEVISELEGSPALTQTLELIGTKWDGASRDIIANHPEIIKVINGHIESGIYAQISSEVERERTFGRLKGLSDLEAYKQVGDAIHAQRGFGSAGRPTQETKAAPVVVKPESSKAPEDEKLREKKRAASPTKAAVAPTTKPDFNPLAMSDDEFSKQIQSKFL